jgi:hypothetical protein
VRRLRASGRGRHRFPSGRGTEPPVCVGAIRFDRGGHYLVLRGGCITGFSRNLASPSLRRQVSDRRAQQMEHLGSRAASPRMARFGIVETRALSHTTAASQAFHRRWTDSRIHRRRRILPTLRAGGPLAEPFRSAARSPFYFGRGVHSAIRGEVSWGASSNAVDLTICPRSRAGTGLHLRHRGCAWMLSETLRPAVRRKP